MPHRRAEGEMAVIAFVERLDQVEAGGRKRRGDLRVRHARPPHDVNRLAEKMITVRDAADGAVVLDRAEGAADNAVGSGGAHRGG
jgi:hypothetical protein